MRALRFSVAVAIAVGLTLLAGDLWLRSINDVPRATPDIAIHPPRISVVIAGPTAKNPSTQPTTPRNVAPTPVELAAVQIPAKATRSAKPTKTRHASRPTQHRVPRTHPVAAHKPTPAHVPAPAQTSTPTATSPTPTTPTPAPNPPTTPTDNPPPTSPPPTEPAPSPSPTPTPTPNGPTGPTEPPATPPVSTPSPVIASGVCASYTSRAVAGAAVTVSFNVFDANCPVSLTSYQSTPTGHTHEAYATDLFATGAWSLTVPLSCNTSNEVDLFLGGPPLVLGGPNSSPDLGGWAIFLPCS